MLRTNQSFLKYVQALYAQQQRKENIVLKQYAKGDMLLSQNEQLVKVLLIQEGITKCFFTEDNDKEYILEFLGKGEILGEIEFIRKATCLCNVEAMTDVWAYAISLDYFGELVNNDLQLNRLLLDAFAERIVNTASRASYQQLYTMDHSLAKLLELEKKLDIEISKEDMASYLGVSIRSLNRTLENMGK